MAAAAFSPSTTIERVGGAESGSLAHRNSDSPLTGRPACSHFSPFDQYCSLGRLPESKRRWGRGAPSDKCIVGFLPPTEVGRQAFDNVFVEGVVGEIATANAGEGEVGERVGGGSPPPALSPACPQDGHDVACAGFPKPIRGKGMAAPMGGQGGGCSWFLCLAVTHSFFPLGRRIRELLSLALWASAHSQPGRFLDGVTYPVVIGGASRLVTMYRKARPFAFGIAESEGMGSV